MKEHLFWINKWLYVAEQIIYCQDELYIFRKKRARQLNVIIVVEKKGSC